MSIAASNIIESIQKRPVGGPIILSLPQEIWWHPCLNCGNKTNNILNYTGQETGIGLAIIKCISNNPKNLDEKGSPKPIVLCNEKCLLAEIEDVLYCILEEVTK